MLDITHYQTILMFSLEKPNFFIFHNNRSTDDSVIISQYSSNKSPSTSFSSILGMWWSGK